MSRRYPYLLLLTLLFALGAVPASAAERVEAAEVPTLGRPDAQSEMFEGTEQARLLALEGYGVRRIEELRPLQRIAVPCGRALLPGFRVATFARPSSSYCESTRSGFQATRTSAVPPPRS